MGRRGWSSIWRARLSVLDAFQKPGRSALYLILFFGMMALQFLLLDALFLAFMQVLVYGGAIMVLYLFVIMLINPREETLPEEGSGSDKGIAFAVSALFFLLLISAIGSSTTLERMGSIPALPPVPEGHGGVAAFGHELFVEHLLVFELASILITIAIVGAVHLSLHGRRRLATDFPNQGEARLAPPPESRPRGEEPAHV